MTTKKISIFIFVIFFASSLFGQNTITIPDYYPNDIPSDAWLFYKNKGQIIDNDKELRPDVLYYNHNGDLRLYMLEDKIAFTQTISSISPTKPNTTYRIDMMPFNSESQVTHGLHEEKSHINHYHHGHCLDGISVQGHARVIYQDYFPNSRFKYLDKINHHLNFA